MRPVLFEAPWGPINAYGTLILLGMLAAFPGVWWDARQRGLPLVAVLDLYLAVFIGAFAGGKIPVWLSSDGGLGATHGFVFYGSAAGAGLALWWVARRYRVSPGIVVTVALTWIAICQAFGRLGCHLAGCCYGAPSTRPGFGLAYPAGSIAYAERIATGLANPGNVTPPLHPVQLYEAAGLVLVAGFVIASRRRRGPRPSFQPAFAWALGYGGLRSITELWRAPSDRTFVWPAAHADVASLLALPPDHQLWLSGSQIVSIGLVTVGIIGLWYDKRRH
ncbi:MAG: prolipoprotein diacylglyceryl transferase [Myxococcales bacterium FL481]|nr:MAG: prolipoprotein diacylglyceryl transferase [Myxococcales bacterium FL481]